MTVGQGIKCRMTVHPLNKLIEMGEQLLKKKNIPSNLHRLLY